MTTKNYNLPDGDRVKKRKELIKCFLNEKPGTGNGNAASRYQYNVESYANYGIFLKRPTQLNKGFDFTVNVRGLYFKKNRRYSNPSHGDIMEALSYCKKHYSENYNSVMSAIREIYECKNVDLNCLNASFIDYEGTKHPIQIIILAIKWLFMEQDCAYWNYSGRKMLFEELSRMELV